MAYASLFAVAAAASCLSSALADSISLGENANSVHKYSIEKGQESATGTRYLLRLFDRRDNPQSISLTTGQRKDQLSVHLPHSHKVRKRQTTLLASALDSGGGGINVKFSHALGGGGGGTTFGGQIGASPSLDATWGFNVGHDTGTTNFGANVGGEFGGSTHWGADAGGTFGGGTSWGANVGGGYDGSTNWGAKLGKTWQHEGGSSSSLGAWLKGGKGGPSAGLKYTLNF